MNRQSGFSESKTIPLWVNCWYTAAARNFDGLFTCQLCIGSILGCKPGKGFVIFEIHTFVASDWYMFGLGGKQDVRQIMTKIKGSFVLFMLII